MGDKIRRAARGRNCTLRLSGCQNDTSTTVFAHAPSIDNGMGLKQARDFWGAFACRHCHDIADGRIQNMTVLAEICQRWLGGVYETQRQLIEEGLITYDDG